MNKKVTLYLRPEQYSMIRHMAFEKAELDEEKVDISAIVRGIIDLYQEQQQKKGKRP